MEKYQYYIIYKPYLMLSQFSREGEKATLADLGISFPKDVYPVGRLDADSEGLLLMTNDKSLNHKLLNPAFNHHRTYLAQVEGMISDEAIAKLKKGIEISINGKKYTTQPAKAEKTEEPAWLPERDPPIRFRKNVPDSWLSLTVTEGKNRQVRKMTAAVGFPTLRLVRWKMENISVEGMLPGDVREMERNEIYAKLKI